MIILYYLLCCLGCVWQGRPCQLIVNHEEGFMLYAAGSRSINGVSPGSPPGPLWKRAFDKLRMSADDGARLLWLDFGDDDAEIVSLIFPIVHNITIYFKRKFFRSEKIYIQRLMLSLHSRYSFSEQSLHIHPG